MKISIEPTPVITRLNGAPCRVWKGVTDGGVDVVVFVSAVAAAEGQDLTPLDRALQTIPPPEEALTPLSLVAPAVKG